MGNTSTVRRTGSDRPGRSGKALSERLAGVTAAITALLTLATAALGLFTAVQHQQIHQLSKQVAGQQQQIQAIGNGKNSVPEAPEGGNYLSDENPAVNNGGDPQAGPVVINGVTYTHSVTFNCYGGGSTPAVMYDIAGSNLSAIIGFGDAAGRYLAGVTATVTISDQTGRIIGDRINISAGHPLQVNLPLSGVNELQFSCSDSNSSTGQSNVTAPVSLGNAQL